MTPIRKAELCDTAGLSLGQVNLLAAMGVVYSTVLRQDGHIWSGDVIAPDWDMAEAVAKVKRRGEVDGQIVEVW